MAKRRQNGEGNLRRRADGRWELSVMDGFREDGKRRFKTFYGKTAKEVREKCKVWQRNREDGIEADRQYLFPEWADIWFENHKDNISPVTQESYRYTLRILKEAFARRRIADIKPYDIESFLERMRREGRSDSYIAQFRGMLFQIFHKAEANDFIRKNPVRFAEKMRRTGPVKRKEAFTRDEVKRLMEELPDNRIGWSIRLLLGTGMRTQELLALEPRHIEPDGSVIHIEQAINMQKGTPVIGTPKSRDSYRDVPVPETVRGCAVRLRLTPAKYIWSIQNPERPGNPSTFRKYFKEALEGIPGMRVLTPHSCRHTYVSQMQALGVDLATIRSMVGHADIDMTQHYLHVQEPVRQEAIARFSREFGSPEDGGDPPDAGAGRVIRFPKAM